MKPACVKCQRFYRVKKNGFKFVEGMPIGSNVPPGTEAPGMWSPYKLWACDLWRCDGCGHELLSGYANRPIVEHYQEGFADAVKAEGADLQINDC